MDGQQRIEQLKTFAQVLKNDGYTVLVSKTHPFKWLNFEKDGGFGYVGQSHDGGFDFVNKHKPSNSHGTGFGVAQNTDLSLRIARMCLHIPYEFHYAIGKVENYKSVNDFINSTHNKWAEYYIY